MALKISFSLLLLGFFYFSFSQLTYSDSIIQKKVVLLKNPYGGHGSGTIIKYQNRFFLLSANHVISHLNEQSVMVFSDINNRVDSIRLRSIFPDPNKHAMHNNADVDILLLTPRDNKDKTILENLSFEFNVIYSELADIPREINVIVYGYPLYSFKNFKAMSYNSYLSSGLLDLQRADTKDISLFYLLENPAMQGFSGGPVFIGMSRQGMTFGPTQTYLIGLVHGTQYDITGGKFSTITPSWFIVDLFKSLKF